MRLAFLLCGLLLLAGCATPSEPSASAPETGQDAADDGAEATDGSVGETGADASAAVRPGPVEIDWSGQIDGPVVRVCLGPAGCGGAGMGWYAASQVWELGGSVASWTHDVSLTWGTGSNPELYTAFALLECQEDDDPEAGDCDVIGDWDDVSGSSPLRLQATHSSVANATHATLYVSAAMTGASGFGATASAGQPFDAVGSVTPV